MPFNLARPAFTHDDAAQLVVESLLEAPVFEDDVAMWYLTDCPTQNLGMASVARLIDCFAGGRIGEIEDLGQAKEILFMIREVCVTAGSEALASGAHFESEVQAAN